MPCSETSHIAVPQSSSRGGVAVALFIIKQDTAHIWRDQQINRQGWAASCILVAAPPKWAIEGGRQVCSAPPTGCYPVAIPKDDSLAAALAADTFVRSASVSVAACVGIGVDVGVVCCYVYFWPVVMLFFDCFVHGPQSRLCCTVGRSSQGGGGRRRLSALCLLFSV